MKDVSSEEGNDMNGIDRRDNGTFIKMQRRGLVQTADPFPDNKEG